MYRWYQNRITQEKNAMPKAPYTPYGGGVYNLKYAINTHYTIISLCLVLLCDVDFTNNFVYVIREYIPGILFCILYML